MRAAKDFVFFASTQTAVPSAAKPEDIGFAAGDPMSPSMSPLRAVVFRGHIAGGRFCINLIESPDLFYSKLQGCVEGSK